MKPIAPVHRLAVFMFRDGLALMLVAVGWAWALSLNAVGMPVPLALGLALGLGTPVAGFLLHEWGHLAGAQWSGAVVYLPPTPAALFLFRFDTGRSTRRQFLAMSMGGFIASALIVAILVVGLPWNLLAARIALALTALGVLATFVLEIPPAWRVYRGGPLPEGAVFVAEGVAPPD